MKPQPKPKDRKLALRCAAEFRRLHPDAEVIFYGSRARGKGEPDSDLDLLVLTERKLTMREEVLVIDCIFDLEMESGVVICPLVLEKNRWKTLKYQVLPWAKAVEKQGISL